MQNNNVTGQYPLPNAIIQENFTNWSDLHDAAANGDEKRLQALLAGTVDRMCKEIKHGNTPLHEASSRGYSRCVKLLCTPPKLENKNKKLKKTVLETRASSLLSSVLGIRNDEGFSALHLAAQNGHNQCCRELLLAGGDPDVQNFYGDTALHTACRYGHAGATRIILSAQCDANKANLNGDTALHISCAMGRRKLTRILLEAGCNVQLTNAQNETPRDIATRKRFKEILEILDNPRTHRSRKKKHRDKDGKDGVHSVSPSKEINWSPYGCHYFPDPRAFPHPKLETLPKEPLKPGEQYYLDLAGQIHKGPVGVGNTCYCGTFFRHIEDKISCNRRSLIKYVHKAKESMGQKVQALAMRTNDQIEQLTRTMIEERARCESRRIYIDRCLRRGEPIRLTADYQLKPKRKYETDDGTLVRSRSMDFLDDNLSSRRLTTSRSCELLNDAIVTVHQADDQIETTCNDAESSPTELSITKLCKSIDEPDMERLTKRLGDLLAKTKILADIAASSDHGNDDENYNDNDENKTDSESSVVDSPTAFNKGYNTAIPKYTYELMNDEANALRNDNLHSCTNTDLDQNANSLANEATALTYQSYKPIYSAANNLFARRNLSSALSQTSIQSQHSSQHEAAQTLAKALPQQCFANDHNLHNVIKALSKDRLNQNAYAEQDCLNENEHISEDKLSYKDEQINELIQNSSQQAEPARSIPMDNNTSASHTVRGLSANFERTLNPTEVLVHNIQERNDYSTCSSITPGRVEKLEIKNCEIKSLKKTSATSNFKTKVQNLVERFQSSTSAQRTNKSTPEAQTPTNMIEKYDSESSEDDQNNHNERLSHTHYAQVVQQQLQQQRMYQNTSSINNSGLPSNTMLPRNLPYLPARTLISLNTKSNNSPVNYSPATQAPLATHPIQYPMNSQRLPQNYQYFPERVVPKDAYFHKLPNKTKTDEIPIGSNNLNYQSGNTLYMSTMPAMANTNYQSAYLSAQQYRQAQLENLQHSPNLQLSPGSGSSYASMSEHALVNRVGLPTPIESSLYRQLPATTYKYQAQPMEQITSVPSNVSPSLQTTHPVERDMLSNDSGFSTRIYYES